MKYFLSFFLIISALHSKAQFYKTYLTANGTYASNPAKAVSYVLYKKLETDSGWAMYQYNMQDSIMVSGTFKDEHLSIQHGKFIFYKLIPYSKHVIYNQNPAIKESAVDLGGNFIDEEGVYLNGKKNGIWKKYTRGKITSVTTYENDIENGLYQTYSFDTGKVLIQGTIINNVREGGWDILSYEGDTLRTDIFKNGVLVKTISFMNNDKFRFGSDDSKAKYDLLAFVNSRLANTKFSKHGKLHSQFAFNLTRKGKLVNPSILKSADKEIDSAIISQLVAAPDWSPNLRTDATKVFLLTSKPIPNLNEENSSQKQQYIPFELDINVDKNGRITISYPKNEVFTYN
ncbi:toxin-antitoxin system YwqK family antitoxin [Mucilaginibacter sp. FT3.2]|uniref:toxin-antitoxin system YwqK family antitoxin n=1 Tax=Mucilaginibacter sp. FT3.2 TaxID=2723090 RepID=UPI00160BE5D6|nr:hypothetical protein [Mucilaginibacter sp. FT3.2]MBB6230274.1 antitoxin component YwqK of YwqJK toxin-antitoxin module [Mucilaginibacter sp. FT3.2]